MRPNPWVAVPTAVAALAGGTIGWVVMGVICRPEGCAGTRLLVTAGGALLAALGVGVVAVLAVLSLEEWRRTASRR